MTKNCDFMGFHRDFMGVFHGDWYRDFTNNGDIDGNYPLVICYIAIENGP